MSSRRGSRKRSRRRNRGKFRTPLLLLGGAGLLAGAWFGFLKPSDTGGLQAQAEQQEAEAAKVAPVTPKVAEVVRPGLTMREAKAHVAKIRAEYAKIESADRRYPFIRGAWQETSKLLEGPMETAVRSEILPLFHELTSIIFFSDYRNEFSTTYVVKSGDSISKIAALHGVSEELVRLWNRIPNNSNLIRPNDSMKIVDGRPRIVVSKSQYTLSYYFGDKLARQYIIAHGDGNRTPVGEVTVVSRQVDPDKARNAGAAQLEMAERWLGFSPFDENGTPRNGFGIHGTKYEDSIPGMTSNGCIRMFNRDVVELYDWVPLRTVVEVRE